MAPAAQMPPELIRVPPRAGACRAVIGPPRIHALRQKEFIPMHTNDYPSNTEPADRGRSMLADRLDALTGPARGDAS
jgi:hypothetical protein